jgi:ammonium transporter, Amt family
MTMLSLLGAVAILAVIPALSILYREFLDRAGLRASIGLTVITSASSLALWLVVSAFVPGVIASPLELPTAALAAVGGFLSSLTVRDTTLHPVPPVLFSLGWTALVFMPVSLVVFFPTSIGIDVVTGPLDLGGALPLHVAIGGSALVVLTLARDRVVGDRSHVRPRSWLLFISGLVIWAGSTVGYVAFELVIDSVVTPRIVVNAIVAPLLGVVGWLIAQRIQTASTNAFGAFAGLLSGIVAIAAGSAYLTPLWAGITGLAAGIGCSLFVTTMVRRTHRHAWFLVGAHLLAGVIGLVMVGLFGISFGFLYDGQLTLVEVQLLSAVIVVVWSALVSFGLWLLVRSLALRSAHSAA